MKCVALIFAVYNTANTHTVSSQVDDCGQHWQHLGKQPVFLHFNVHMHLHNVVMLCSYMPIYFNTCSCHMSYISPNLFNSKTEWHS